MPGQFPDERAYRVSTAERIADVELRLAALELRLAALAGDTGEQSPEDPA